MDPGVAQRFRPSLLRKPRPISRPRNFSPVPGLSGEVSRVGKL